MNPIIWKKKRGSNYSVAVNARFLVGGFGWILEDLMIKSVFKVQLLEHNDHLELNFRKLFSARNCFKRKWVFQKKLFFLIKKKSCVARSFLQNRHRCHVFCSKSWKNENIRVFRTVFRCVFVNFLFPKHRFAH